MMALGGLLAVGLLGFLVVWLTGSKGLPAGPLLPLQHVVHAKGNPHVFFDLEARNRDWHLLNLNYTHVASLCYTNVYKKVIYI